MAGIGLALTNAILIAIIIATAIPSAAFLQHPRFQQGKKELLGLSHRHLLPCGFSPSQGGEERVKGGMWVMEASKPSAEQDSLAMWQRYHLSLCLSVHFPICSSQSLD